tara:strand:- start:169 stop:384 length:216 start_codon:yes stop_codon:yes gene_type:complete
MAKKKAKKKRTNNQYTDAFKAKVVREYAKGKKSLAAVAEKHDIYPQMIVRWKKQFPNGAAPKKKKKKAAKR